MASIVFTLTSDIQYYTLMIWKLIVWRTAKFVGIN